MNKQLLKSLFRGVTMRLKQEFNTEEDFFEYSDSIDTYDQDYAQEMLDNDELDMKEMAFLQGYEGWL